MPSPVRRRAVAAATTAALACTLALTPLTAAVAAPVTTPLISDSVDGAALKLTPLDTFESGVFGESAAEIVQAYRDRLYVVNALSGSVTVLDNSDPTNLRELFALSATGTANSLAIRDDGLGVIAFEAEDKTANGSLVFFDANASSADTAILGSVTVGALPDMVTISKDGAYAVVANEGEPADDYSVDPEGSIGVVALPKTVSAPAQAAVKIAGFGAFEAGGTKTLDPKVRVFGPDIAAPDQGAKPLAANRVSRNLEPEYITVDGTTAYVALQEANAIAVVDLAKAEVGKIMPLGDKDWGTVGLDASDRDPEDAPTIDITTYPGLKGLYMPDGIQSYAAGGKTYLVTANEGDAREWGFDENGDENAAYFIDEARVKDLGKKGVAGICADSPLSAIPDVQKDDVLGRLKVVTDLGIASGADCYSELYAYGARSFSIWNTDGTLVFDSGDQFEQLQQRLVGQGLVFNASNDNNDDNDRSDDKGVEPENVAVGTVGERTYAFVGFERVGGVAVYDITDPAAAEYVTYVSRRDFTADVESSAAGDLGPEGIQFVPAHRSPTGQPLLVTGNEVSGTTTVFAVEDLLADEPDVRILTVNDFHGRLVQETGGVAGAAVLAGAVDSFRQQNPNTLFVSAGDNIGASAFESFIDDDNPTIDALKAAGLDLGAVGNHEFDRGFTDLTERVIPRFGAGEPASDGGADFALGANVYEKGTKTPALKPYTIREVDGTRIAFIGTVTQQTAGMVSPDGIATIDFGDQVEAANREAAKIVANDEADVIILLTHEGAATSDITDITEGDDAFAQLVQNASPEIDAIVSAHTHQRYAHEIDGRPVIQAHQYGTALGTLDIELTDAGELESITGGTVSLYDGTTSQYIAYPQAATKAVVDAAVTTANLEGQKTVGAITADILRGKTSGGAEDRGVHSTLGNTVADVYLWATSDNPAYGGQDAQIAFMNPGGLRADLLFGDDNGAMSYREVANVQPFGNTLVTLDLTPAQIKAVLEQQWQPAGASRPKLAMGVSKGFTFEYDPAAAAGSHIVSMQLDGEELSPTDTTTSIRIVTNSFLSGGGDNFVSFRQGTNVADSGQIDLQATVDFFAAASGPVAPSPANRAYLVGEQPPVEGEPGEGENPGGENPGGELPGTGEPTAAQLLAALKAAKVALGATSVTAGGTFTVDVAGLLPGQRIGAELRSDPITITGIPAANASGAVSFTVAVPADLPVGTHHLVLISNGTDAQSFEILVTAPGTAQAIAATGGTFPIGFVSVLAAGILVAGLVMLLRRRTTADV
ncbi:choice-of-anchor I family protein [Microbacterium telephonicum]|uniref:2',3'-cyclic-nucleotide 2'-phosphodiesterase (5'-nucleotidase family) n=1 Tax=Microbacterium telephonicum TaxID=1714841 RepID=A0A498BTF0_9MICO|nr:choice-of-anchor I family protein [Microbacterium telephonicum]RLK46712.1 2',3'-cyclic-nucleotide 2'-phosphodiesterase (5'-nucleotidase family) [Microbacterium telephonicum]